MVPWDPHESAPNGITIGSAVFVGRDQQTNTHTHRQTDRHTGRPRYSVCSNSLHPCNACDAA